MLLLAGNLLHFTFSAIGDLDDVSLQVQAGQIERHLTGPGEAAQLNLPEPLREAYLTSGDGYLFALLDEQGQVLASSSEKARQFMRDLPPELLQRREAFFRLPDSNGRESSYSALLRRPADRDDLRIVVAQGQLHQDVFVDTLLAEFMEHIGWTLPVILVLALSISLWTIRSSLAPVKALSARAAAIGPTTTDIRLPATGVPEEIQPLVNAINSAFDRLQQGFELQRQFTANAAHELRTPLAVLTARLDELANDETARQLRQDVQRMNRLVDQLLKVSRLDAAAIRLDEDVELNGLAAEVVAYLAPLAIAAGKSVALVPANRPVRVTGSATALNDALRNLVENALAHTPGGSEVTVTVTEDATIGVRDRGPGVPEAQRARIFERFWRAPGSGGTGAGLGLAIVAQTARAHGGGVGIRDADGGGAEFILHLPRR